MVPSVQLLNLVENQFPYVSLLLLLLPTLVFTLLLPSQLPQVSSRRSLVWHQLALVWEDNGPRVGKRSHSVRYKVLTLESLVFLLLAVLQDEADHFLELFPPKQHLQHFAGRISDVFFGLQSLEEVEGKLLRFFKIKKPKNFNHQNGDHNRTSDTNKESH